MNSMNNALAQLALLLRGSGMGGGLGNDWSIDNPNSSAPPMQPMGMPFQNQSMMPGANRSMSGRRRAVVPAEFLLFGSNPAYEMPYGDWALPKPEILPIPDTGPLPPDLVPPIPLFPPYNSPYPIPGMQGDGTTGAPPNVDTYPPFNPPLEIPDERIDDGTSEYGDQPKKMSKRCKEEWAWAAEHCQKEKLKYYDSGNFDKPFDLERCMRGYVSEACGGNPNDWGTKGKPYTPPQKPPRKGPQKRPYKPLQA
jgi:hypothetical protein